MVILDSILMVIYIPV